MKLIIQSTNLKALAKAVEVCKIAFLVLCRFYSLKFFNQFSLAFSTHFKMILNHFLATLRLL